MTPESPKLEACPFCPGDLELHGGEAVWHKNRDDFLACPIAYIGIRLDAWNTRRPAPTASPAPEGVVEVVGFLLGEASLRGTWYGDRPTKDSAPYWWRDDLRNAMAHVQSQSSTMAELREEVDRAHEAVVDKYVDQDYEKIAKDTQEIKAFRTPKQISAFVWGVQHGAHLMRDCLRAALKPVARGE